MGDDNAKKPADSPAATPAGDDPGPPMTPAEEAALNKAIGDLTGRVQALGPRIKDLIDSTQALADRVGNLVEKGAQNPADHVERLAEERAKENDGTGVKER